MPVYILPGTKEYFFLQAISRPELCLKPVLLPLRCGVLRGGALQIHYRVVSCSALLFPKLSNIFAPPCFILSFVLDPFDKERRLWYCPPITYVLCSSCS
jgi:hypothetical protein